ncbi:hypothetical protein YYC_03240 [Plasmodium yoelii 17X]|uniref:Uncharacterized protein n=4 Tax=Plasmodium yoelii TaxID=5861 RepID=A0AAE9WWB8_PLAYO|nr:conserved Plasmodium protein, unknown function [Plasmodium yoelii]ETB59867.1 hypothetical protein YYC_03240 [Plasmodium yoelii 17X]WBY57799.1 hypothetical protein Py17XNL_001002121 [Plasmodium yoelii yoelii]CDU84904.1 conserved Plasmodium protein, unknown function [Plasmodium yoelii]VTZ78800.1 conserved Plasmodium protein, unknown function [Plasmodium yoelii]|eukprot:XP_726116.2 conserved Plasmodium protein, unknown function [Plasmodium yoelii]
MHIMLKRHIKGIYNVKNMFLKSNNFINVTKNCNNIYFNEHPPLNIGTYSKSHGFFFFNESFVNLFTKKKDKIICEMRRDRGGTVRKKLSREKKKTQKKQKKENTRDIHK